MCFFFLSKLLQLQNFLCNFGLVLMGAGQVADKRNEQQRRADRAVENDLMRRGR
jgi:hypothetical protein